MTYGNRGTEAAPDATPAPSAAGRYVRNGSRAAAGLAAVLGVWLVACSGDGAEPIGPAGSVIVLELRGLPPLDPGREGRYAAWIVDARDQRHHAGELELSGAGLAEIEAPIAGGVAIEITIEPPSGVSPSDPLRLLHGRFSNGRAELSVRGAVTAADLPLRQRPGQFTMFTPSDNREAGYPSHEEAGVWLFNMAPRETEQNDQWVRLTPLRPGWIYEGWMVRDIDSPGAIWLSYGKFLPDAGGAVNTRDDTGWGPFSGVVDFRTAGEEEYPGDDWISNPLGFPWPSELTLPLNLRERTPSGEFRWTHVITIEPATDRGEPIGSERPFLIRPYRDPFGDGGPGAARTITFREDGVPSGTARVR